MELNLVPLIEAAKGLTWQGAAVIICIVFGVCYIAKQRLVHGDRERAFWREATPEQIMARAATAATLPPPTKAPPSTVGPVLVVLLVAAGLVWQPLIAGIRFSPVREASDFNPDRRPEALPVYSMARR